MLLRFGVTSMAERANLNYINSFNSIMLLMRTERIGIGELSFADGSLTVLSKSYDSLSFPCSAFPSWLLVCGA